MTQNIEHSSVERSLVLESELYDAIQDFFQTEKKCDKTGSSRSSPISMKIFGGIIYPDVFGISAPTQKNYQVFMAEGKRNFQGRNFDECKGQALSLQRFADFVYLFLPKSAWNELDEEERSDIEEECGKLKLGLLIVDDGRCEERSKPDPNPEILKEENRQTARDKIASYFPDFAGPIENLDFFQKYNDFANTIVEESRRLLEELVESFRKKTGVSKQSIKTDYGEDKFVFFLRSKLKSGKIYLRMRPFGSEYFEAKFPILFIEEKLNRSILKRPSTTQKLSRRIEECLKRKGRITTQEYVIYEQDTLKDALKYINESKSEEFSIIESIAIAGIEKEKIKENVEKMLERSVSFIKSFK